MPTKRHVWPPWMKVGGNVSKPEIFLQASNLIEAATCHFVTPARRSRGVTNYYRSTHHERHGKRASGLRHLHSQRIFRAAWSALGLVEVANCAEMTVRLFWLIVALGRRHLTAERTTMRNVCRLFAILGGALACSACASMPDWLKPAPVTDSVRLESNPPGAEAKISNGLTCRTPCSLALPVDAPLTVTFALDGYIPDSRNLEPTSTAGLDTRIQPNPVSVDLTPTPPPTKPVKKPTKKRTTRKPAPKKKPTATTAPTGPSPAAATAPVPAPALMPAPAPAVAPTTAPVPPAVSAPAPAETPMPPSSSEPSPKSQ